MAKAEGPWNRRRVAVPTKTVPRLSGAGGAGVYTKVSAEVAWDQLPGAVAGNDCHGGRGRKDVTTANEAVVLPTGRDAAGRGSDPSCRCRRRGRGTAATICACTDGYGGMSPRTSREG